MLTSDAQRESGMAAAPLAARRPSVPALFLLAVASLLLSPFAITRPALDRLNVLPALAASYLLWCVVAPRKALGHIDVVARSLATDPRVAKPRAAFLLSARVRASLLLPLAFLGFEFLLRCGSYHRTLVYERQGDLLFTPVPNQEAIEKISLTPSRINARGLRGEPLTPERLQRRIVLCLGDSITHGYGVDDAHTYPAQLQAVLDREYPQQFTVLNGGVNAYPMSFIHQKFLYLWKAGIHPEIVVIGYSMNEGWLGHLVDSDEATKARFARRVRLKNVLRGFALYNLVVENWGVAYYEQMKGRMVPGTHTDAWLETDYQQTYQRVLERMTADFHARNVAPVFVVFSAFDGATGAYDTAGFLQRQFAGFAAAHGIPYVLTDEVFREAAGGSDIEQYFRDRCHMNERGNAELARRLADVLARIGGAPASPGPQAGTQ